MMRMSTGGRKGLCLLAGLLSSASSSSSSVSSSGRSWVGLVDRAFSCAFFSRSFSRSCSKRFVARLPPNGVLPEDFRFRSFSYNAISGAKFCNLLSAEALALRLPLEKTDDVSFSLPPSARRVLTGVALACAFVFGFGGAGTPNVLVVFTAYSASSSFITSNSGCFCLPTTNPAAGPWVAPFSLTRS